MQRFTSTPFVAPGTNPPHHHDAQQQQPQQAQTPPHIRQLQLQQLMLLQKQRTLNARATPPSTLHFDITARGAGPPPSSGSGSFTPNAPNRSQTPTEGLIRQLQLQQLKLMAQQQQSHLTDSEPLNVSDLEALLIVQRHLQQQRQQDQQQTQHEQAEQLQRNAIAQAAVAAATAATMTPQHHLFPKTQAASPLNLTRTNSSMYAAGDEDHHFPASAAAALLAGGNPSLSSNNGGTATPPCSMAQLLAQWSHQQTASTDTHHQRHQNSSEAGFGKRNGSLSGAGGNKMADPLWDFDEEGRGGDGAEDGLDGFGRSTPHHAGHNNGGGTKPNGGNGAAAQNDSRKLMLSHTPLGLPLLVQLGHNMMLEGHRKDAIQHLALNFNSILDEEFAQSGIVESCLPTLQVLELFGNNIGNLTCELLARGMQHPHHLSRIKLGNNQIGDAGAEFLGKGLKGNQTLIQLHLSNNQIGDHGIQALASGLTGHPALTSLGLRDNCFGEVGAAALARMLMDPKCIVGELQIKRNKFGVGGAMAFAFALPSNCSLRVLEFESTNQVANSVPVLAEALKRNNVVHALNLNDNNIGDDGAQSVGKLLVNNDVLTSVGLRGNNLTQFGVFGLCKGLCQNSRLTGLDIGNNAIGSQGAIYLAAVMRVNTHLQSLDLFSNQIYVKGILAIASALESPTASLKHLDLASNFSRDRGAAALAEMLQFNSSLTRLSVTDNEITNRGGQSLFTGLQRNFTICHFNFGGQSTKPPRANTITGNLRFWINQCITRNRSLKGAGPPNPQQPSVITGVGIPPHTHNHVHPRGINQHPLVPAQPPRQALLSRQSSNPHLMMVGTSPQPHQPATNPIETFLKLSAHLGHGMGGDGDRLDDEENEDGFASTELQLDRMMEDRSINNDAGGEVAQNEGQSSHPLGHSGQFPSFFGRSVGPAVTTTTTTITTAADASLSHSTNQHGPEGGRRLPLLNTSPSSGMAGENSRRIAWQLASPMCSTAAGNPSSFNEFVENAMNAISEEYTAESMDPEQPCHSAADGPTPASANNISHTQADRLQFLLRALEGMSLEQHDHPTTPAPATTPPPLTDGEGQDDSSDYNAMVLLCAHRIQQQQLLRQQQLQQQLLNLKTTTATPSSTYSPHFAGPAAIQTPTTQFCDGGC